MARHHDRGRAGYDRDEGEITAKVRQGLIPALGAGAGSAEGATRPKNEEAYDLYLRSIAVPHDPAPNKDAIAMLERAVELDSTYAPAWNALGRRYHYDSAYSNGGEAAFQRSHAALERAVTLDPNFIEPAGEITGAEVERGQFIKAYQDAKALVDRHPEKASAHFALSYVLRYGGAIEESAHECETALALDPGNYAFRSCVFSFEQLGNYARAKDFLQLDAGSAWTASNMIGLYIREGKLGPVRDLAERFRDQRWAPRCLRASIIRAPRTQRYLRSKKQPTFLRILTPKCIMSWRVTCCSADRRNSRCG
jgi:tetratricopeptide (TPR) repeat protein